MNNYCTFFGHRICPEKIKEILFLVIEKLINEKNIYHFLLGKEGNYDKYVLETLEKLSLSYKHISYTVVQAYLPLKKYDEYTIHYSRTLFPDELSKVPKRFAISRRNDWMLKHSDIVITYVTHLSGGGASDFKEKAIKAGKTVIELSDFL